MSYVLKRSHHGLVETTPVINLPNPAGHLRLGDKFLDDLAKSCWRLGLFSAMERGYLALPTLLSVRRHQVVCRDVRRR
jgi:hypothetical protein